MLPSLYLSLFGGKTTSSSRTTKSTSSTAATKKSTLSIVNGDQMNHRIRNLDLDSDSESDPEEETDQQQPLDPHLQELESRTKRNATKPVCQLLSTIFESLFQYVDVNDGITRGSVLLVCRSWSEAAVIALYGKPAFVSGESFSAFTQLLTVSDSWYPYPELVTNLTIEGAAADAIEMGDLETTLGLCPNIASFSLLSCPHISSILLQSLADFCPSLDSLVLAGCPIGDGKIPILVSGCPKLRKVDLSCTNVSIHSLDVLVTGLTLLEDINLDFARGEVKESRSDSPTSSSENQLHMTPTTPYLSTVSLSGVPLTPSHLRLLSYRAPHVTSLNLSSSPHLNIHDIKPQHAITDDVVAIVARGFPTLVELNLDWCSRVTDVSLQSLAVHMAGRARDSPNNNVNNNIIIENTLTNHSHQSSTSYKPSTTTSTRKASRANTSLAKSSSPTSPSSSSLTNGTTPSPRHRWISTLERLGVCGTSITPQGIKLLSRECGALIELRLDGCVRVMGTVVELVAVEAWKVKERVRRDSMKRVTPPQSPVGGAVMKSRLPVLKGKVASSSGSNSGEVDLKPPIGWCRILDRESFDALAGWEGAW
ncbi:hypothetical protein HDU76_007562 [Blyttiomyces sp. JEL0837]|nr:hypothetical protein HDU76_007562 [Blyttiomyces sp. JEL0837]